MLVLQMRRQSATPVNKRAESHWLPTETARAYPWLVAKRDRSRAQSAYLLQRGPAFRVGRTHPYCVCECLACGTWCAVDEAAVRAGRTISCGCKKEIHGLSGDSKKNRTYQQWRVMRRRHKDGIKVQPEWINKSSAHGLKAMISDLGETPEGMVLREVVVGGGYVRGNVHWVEVGPIHNRKKDALEVRLFAPTAQCPKCGSFNTRTVYTRPKRAVRYHECMEGTCGGSFVTKMAEKQAINGRPHR
jgi:hypothetical protein